MKMLANGPHMPESLQLDLPDRDDMWRIRLPISDWRMIFRVDNANREIEIVRIRRRSSEDVYSGYERS
jgi:mRNA-degrading endonuclease RelE of RelBE toxin-antitoxin system